MHWFVKFILAPILIFQGKSVRKNTLRLPEASGQRKGIQGSGETNIRILIIGDSASAGVGIDRQANALSGQILICFGQGYKIEWELFPALPCPLKSYLGRCAGHLNRALRNWLKDQADSELLEFNLP